MTELKQKRMRLVDYCQDLKKALKQSVQGKENQFPGRSNLKKQGKYKEINRKNLMPVSHEVMVEGFLHVVSEASRGFPTFHRSLSIHHGLRLLESHQSNRASRVSRYKLFGIFLFSNIFFFLILVFPPNHETYMGSLDFDLMLYLILCLSYSCVILFCMSF